MLTEKIALVLYGIAGMALLAVVATNINPAYRCINDRGSAWLGAPVNRCYRLTDLLPASAFTPAR